jgi:hypothetical protein
LSRRQHSAFKNAIVPDFRPYAPILKRNLLNLAQFLPRVSGIKLREELVLVLGRELMKRRLSTELGSKMGSISTDWIVLTGALVGTGVAVVGNLDDTASSEAYEASQAIAAGRLGGAVVAQSHGPSGCSGGVDRLQNLAGNHSDPGLLSRISGMGDKELRRAFDRIRPMAERDETVMTALECEMVRRGFGG